MGRHREQRIRSPFGSKPSALSFMLRDFDRAGEDAWLVGLSYDFAPELGVKGLSAFVNYARGNGRHAALTGSRLVDEDELDLTVDYRFTAGPLTGLWLRVRGALVRELGGDRDTQNEFRAILNYELPLGDVSRRLGAGRRGVAAVPSGPRTRK